MIWLGIIIGYLLCAIGTHFLRRDDLRSLAISRDANGALKELLRLEKEQAAKDVNRWKCVALNKPWPEKE